MGAGCYEHAINDEDAGGDKCANSNDDDAADWSSDDGDGVPRLDLCADHGDVSLESIQLVLGWISSTYRVGLDLNLNAGGKFTFYTEKRFCIKFQSCCSKVCTCLRGGKDLLGGPWRG
jgi:hypothetical protein